MRFASRTAVVLGIMVLLAATVQKVAADSTAGGNNCKGHGREVWQGGAWVPAYVGCYPNNNVCPALNGATCQIQSIGYAAGVEYKVCACVSGGVFMYDTSGSGIPNNACCPREAWVGDALQSVACMGPCTSGTCQREYTLQNANEREFKCACQ